MYVMLDEFHERRGASLSGNAIAAALRRRCEDEVREAIVSVFGAPPVDGLGSAGGFKLMVEDRGNLGLGELQTAADADRRPRQRHPRADRRLHQPAGQHALALSGHRSAEGQIAGRAAQRRLRRPAGLHGLALRQQLQPVRPLLAGQRAGRRRFPPHARRSQATEGPQRPGEMVPLGTLITARDTSGPVMVLRYNMYPAAADQRQRGARHQLRPGHRAHGAASPIKSLPRR